MAIHPFSILDTRTKQWQSLKKRWLSQHNIQSELGREDTISNSGFWETKNSVSVFDPVLCQVMYEWFVPPHGAILDPFAGGSVRGIVATELGFDYTGIDLSQKQIEANRFQSDVPKWIVGDATDKLLEEEDDSYDFIFTCPPYHDLEVYSDDCRDLSNMEYKDFIQKLSSVIGLASQKLKNNRFCSIVVSEIRDLTTTHNYKIGKYKGFVSDVVKLFEQHGLHFYNDMILFNSQHQASRTAGTYFKRNRKIASVHQNVLVFVKGNPDLATEDITNPSTYICTIYGKQYKSLRIAAITLDPNVLVASEVERRCKSTKSKYKEWQIIGNVTRPSIQNEVDGVPFESVQQIVNLIGGDFSKSMANTRIHSNSSNYRHWKSVNPSDYNISYEEMDQLQIDSTIRLILPVIICNTIDFYSLQEAADYFNVSAERIRQKLKSESFPEFKYLY